KPHVPFVSLSVRAENPCQRLPTGHVSAKTDQPDVVDCSQRPGRHCRAVDEADSLRADRPERAAAWGGISCSSDFAHRAVVQKKRLPSVEHPVSARKTTCRKLFSEPGPIELNAPPSGEGSPTATTLRMSPVSAW